MNLILLGAPQVSQWARQAIEGFFAGSQIKIQEYMLPVSSI